jgi:quercetin dioxygenase-like cupin family protein
LVVGDDTAGGFAMVESVVPPGEGSGLHRHQRTDEALHILEGALTVVAGGRTVRAEAGAFVYVPHGVVHECVNSTDEPARLLLVISPSGLEEVYEELTELYQQGHPDPATIRAVQLKHDLEVLEG